MKSYADLCGEMSHLHSVLKSQSELLKKLQEKPLVQANKRGEFTSHEIEFVVSMTVLSQSLLFLVAVSFLLLGIGQ